MTIGKRLKELREKRDLTVEELASEIHLTKSSIWTYENGTKEPSVSHLIRLAEYYQVSVDFLLGRESDQQVSIDLEKLIVNNNYSIRIDNQDLSANEIKEAVAYIKIRRVMEGGSL